jgi:hypothetical protein
MRYLKKYKLFESVSEKTVRDILLDITDDSNFNVEIKEVDNHLEVYITRGSYLDSRKTREIPGAPTPPGSGYPANLFLWFEIKDTIIRLCEYVYSETGLEPIENKPFQQWYLQQEHFAKSPFRMINSGTEFGIGWHKAEDFTLGDFISFTGLKLIIKL